MLRVEGVIILRGATGAADKSELVSRVHEYLKQALLLKQALTLGFNALDFILAYTLPGP